ncbi:hypothetical protein J2Y49_001488 [Azospirillum sp. BE72]|nr:hypothetical protein [Azospirillum sp. BE72]
MIDFADRIVGRYLYERDVASPLAEGQPAPTPIIWLSAADHQAAPWDLYDAARRAGRLVSLSVGILFPHLSSDGVRLLGQEGFDALWRAVRRTPPAERLGARGTRDYVLARVFGLDDPARCTKATLIGALLRLHYAGRVLPPELAGHWLERVPATGRFGDLPLESMFYNRSAFFEFLQSQWEPFLRAQLSLGSGFREVLVPFDADEIRPMVNNMFADGLLTPSTLVPIRRVADSWLAAGVVDGAAPRDYARMERLTQALKIAVPGPDEAGRAWLAFAPRFGDWLALRRSLVMEEPAEMRDQRDKLRDRVDGAFTAWMVRHYTAQASLPPWPAPAVVHQLPAYMDALRRLRGVRRLALVVVDGMSWADWMTIRPRLGFGGRLQQIGEAALFAQLPTLTDVSRRSIFSGLSPRCPQSAKGTEEALWFRTWEAAGAQLRSVRFRLQGGQESDSAFVAAALDLASDERVEVLGLVAATIDRSLHGAVAGPGAYHEQIARWAKDGHLARLIAGLAEHSFRVLVTSDHGNVHATGVGRPPSGKLAEERGERVMVFDRPELAQSTRESDDSMFAPESGVAVLPGQHVLLAAGRSAFLQVGADVITHGGAALEEVIVPLIEYESK